MELIVILIMSPISRRTRQIYDQTTAGGGQECYD